MAVDNDDDCDDDGDDFDDVDDDDDDDYDCTSLQSIDERARVASSWQEFIPAPLKNFPLSVSSSSSSS